MKSLRASKVFCVIDLICHLPLILEVKEVVMITKVMALFTSLKS